MTASATTATFSKRATDRFRQLHGMDPTEAAGLRHLTTVGGTGLVGLYNADEAGHDTGDGETAWSTVCELHAHIVGHRTYRLALWHAPDVTSWRETCMDVKAGDACSGCGSHSLWSAFVDAEGLAVVGDLESAPGVTYSTFCNDCGTRQ